MIRECEMNIDNESLSYPNTDMVILAGGRARRMNGLNKLLQTFDDQIQLIKLHQCFKNRVQRVWVNSHRDHGIYRGLVPHVGSFADDQAGFLGPIMGMKSAWSHVESDYILFVPCDVTYVPAKVLSRLHRALARHSKAKVAYVEINDVALRAFCLMHRDGLHIVEQHIRSQQYDLKACFQELNAQVATFQHRGLFLQRIRSLDQLQQHRQLYSLPK